MKNKLVYKWAITLGSTLALLSTAPTVFADASVVIKVRVAKDEKAVDGKVTITQREGDKTFSCQTKEGSCRIEGVPGGGYWVDFVPAEGAAPKRRPVMIPPQGEATLHVATSK